MSLIVILIGFLPGRVIGIMEDRELIQCYGDQNRDYIKEHNRYLSLAPSADFYNKAFISVISG